MTATTKFDLDPNLVRKLAKLLEETGLSEIEYAEGDRKIRCAINKAGIVETIVNPPAPAAAAQGAQAQVPMGTPVPAPMVGTVYLSPGPGQPQFFKKGDKVKAGDTLLIIEAMKVMNAIKAPTGGTIGEILVSDATPVEFGETLLVIT